MGLLNPGEKFGDFDVIRELGHGGMGAVYLVRDPETGAKYAAKIMLENPLHGDDFKRRFIREAEIAMRAEHPNLVHVYAVGRDPDTGYAYMIMDYVGGGDLHQAIALRLSQNRGPYKSREALSVIRPLLGALSAAVKAGVVHRDIKPDNILFAEDGTPMLTDLGVAKLNDDQTLTRLTMSNVIVGTPLYMSPEQMTDSHAVDIRSDLYSLGIVLWEMLAGECPNADLSTSDLMARALKGARLPDIRTVRPKTPVYMVKFLRRMTEPKAERRFATPDEAIRYLDEWRAQEKRKFRLFVAGALAIGAMLLAAAIYFGLQLVNVVVPGDETLREEKTVEAAPAPTPEPKQAQPIAPLSKPVPAPVSAPVVTPEKKLVAPVQSAPVMKPAVKSVELSVKTVESPVAEKAEKIKTKPPATETEPDVFSIPAGVE